MSAGGIPTQIRMRFKEIREVFLIKQSNQGLFSALPGLGGGVLNLQSALLALSKPALVIIYPLIAPPECMPQKNIVENLSLDFAWNTYS